MTAYSALLAFGTLGALAGIAYFATLEWNVQLYFDRRSGWAAVAAHAARLIAAALCFAAIARGAGAAALLSAFSGFLAVRMVAVGRMKRRVEGAV